MKTRKIISRILIIAGILSICSAISLIIYNNVEDSRAVKSNNEVLASAKEKIEYAGTEETSAGNGENSGSTETEETAGGYMPSVNVSGYDCIGYLSIPAIDIEYPILDNWDYKKLKVAPCRYYGSVYTRDLVIAGHNYRSVFGKLKRLKKGDTVYFTDVKNETYKYDVELVEILEPTDIREMVESPFDLTLYTCTYGGKQRVTVRCMLAK